MTLVESIDRSSVQSTLGDFLSCDGEAIQDWGVLTAEEIAHLGALRSLMRRNPDKYTWMLEHPVAPYAEYPSGGQVEGIDLDGASVSFEGSQATWADRRLRMGGVTGYAATILNSPRQVVDTAPL